MKKSKAILSLSGGDVVIELRAMGALPIEGVLSNLKGQIIDPEPRDDESVIRWTVPVETTSGCVFYGVVTPLGRVWGAPKYERSIFQDGALVQGLTNPAKVATRKLNPGEYVGAPEAVRFVKKKQGAA